MYVTYQRRAPSDDGETASRTYRLAGGAQVAGTIYKFWVMLHSPKLSTLFQCVLNVVLCISPAGGIKYFFK